jgi:branched-subunit amino acid ABC-type transport system permease component
MNLELPDSSLVIAQLISGVYSSILITLVALGISLIFGVARIVNLAHGSFYMVGAYLMTSLVPMRDGLAWFVISVAISSIGVGLLAGLFELALIRRIYKKGAHLQIMITFGMLLCINAGVELIWGTEYRSVDRPELLAESIDLYGITIPMYNLALVVVGVCLLFALWLLINRTRWGRNLRASGMDREMLGALGVDINWLSTQVFVLASMLAGLAGAIASPLFAVSLQLGFDSSLSSFVVVVIGGLGSLYGALWASLLVNESQALSVLFAPKISAYIPYAMMLVALVLRYGKSAYVYGLEKIAGEEGA